MRFTQIKFNFPFSVARLHICAAIRQDSDCTDDLEFEFSSIPGLQRTIKSSELERGNIFRDGLPAGATQFTFSLLADLRQHSDGDLLEIGSISPFSAIGRPHTVHGTGGLHHIDRSAEIWGREQKIVFRNLMRSVQLFVIFWLAVDWKGSTRVSADWTVGSEVKDFSCNFWLIVIYPETVIICLTTAKTVSKYLREFQLKFCE